MIWFVLGTFFAAALMINFRPIVWKILLSLGLAVALGVYLYSTSGFSEYLIFLSIQFFALIFTLLHFDQLTSPISEKSVFILTLCFWYGVATLLLSSEYLRILLYNTKAWIPILIGTGTCIYSLFNQKNLGFGTKAILFLWHTAIVTIFCYATFPWGIIYAQNFKEISTRLGLTTLEYSYSATQLFSAGLSFMFLYTNFFILIFGIRRKHERPENYQKRLKNVIAKFSDEQINTKEILIYTGIVLALLLLQILQIYTFKPEYLFNIALVLTIINQRFFSKSNS
jgi:hypothetical protein